MSAENTMSEFVRENSNFLLSTFAMGGLCFSGLLLFILKSRCRTFKCGCIQCDREVISEENLNEIHLQSESFNSQLGHPTSTTRIAENV